MHSRGIIKMTSKHANSAIFVFFFILFIGAVVMLVVFKFNLFHKGDPPPPPPVDYSWKAQANKVIYGPPTQDEIKSAFVGTSTVQSCTDHCRTNVSGSTYGFFKSNTSSCICRKPQASVAVSNCYLSTPSSEWTTIGPDSIADCPDPTKVVQHSDNITRGARDIGVLYSFPATEESCMTEVALLPNNSTNYGVLSTDGKCYIKEGSATGIKQDYKAECWTDYNGGHLYWRYDASPPWDPQANNRCPNTDDCILPQGPDGTLAIPSSSLLAGNPANSNPKNPLDCAKACKESNTALIPYYGEQGQGACSAPFSQAGSLFLPDAPNHKCYCYDWIEGFYDTANENNGDVYIPPDITHPDYSNPDLEKDSRDGAIFQVDMSMAPKGCSATTGDSKVVRSETPTEVGTCYCKDPYDYEACLKPDGCVSNCKNNAVPYIYDNPTRVDTGGSESAALAQCACFLPGQSKLPLRRYPYWWSEKEPVFKPDISAGVSVGQTSTANDQGGFWARYMTSLQYPGQKQKTITLQDGSTTINILDTPQRGQPCVNVQGGECAAGLHCLFNKKHPECTYCG